MTGLIIANGTMLKRKHAREIAAHSDVIVCADGGANSARSLGIRPDVILGDLDSITALTRKFFRAVPLLSIEDQNSTDMEKAIDYCLQRCITSVDVIGGTGDRIDHTTGNLGCFKKFGDRMRLRFIDTVGVLTQIHDSTRFSAELGEKLSLIPLDRCSGVTTVNLKYRLTNDILELGVREGISNEAVGKKVSITLRRGTLLLYRFHRDKYLSR